MEWQRLYKYNGNAPPATVLDRNSEMRAAYYKYLKSSAVSQFKSRLKHLFMLNEYAIVIAYNKFPYNIAADIAHLVLWINPEKNRDEFELRIHLNLLLGEKNYVLYKNPPQIQTIGEIKHYQLFVPKKYLDQLSITDLD